MTIEEAHIKAVLELSETDGDSIIVQVSTQPGDDPDPFYEIIRVGEYEGGDQVIGYGDSWEEAFEKAIENKKD